MTTVVGRRWWALGALALTLLAVGLDLTVLNVALPTMAVDLHANTSQLQWVVDAYTLALAAMLLPAGLLGDRYGRKKLLFGAAVRFGLASLGCAYAPNAETLIAVRAVLGVGAAFLIPLSMAVLTVLFDPEERPKALAIWVTANMLGIPLGPILGGWLLDHFWWGSVFLINVPVIAIGLIAIGTLLPESRASVRPSVDYWGVILSSLGLIGITYGVIEAGEHGWGGTSTVVSLIIGAALTLVFVLWQRRAAEPLVDLSLFRSRGFTWGAILLTLVTFTMFGLLFAMPQYFQSVQSATALGTGLRLLPMIGGMLVGVRAGTAIAARIGDKITVALGFAIVTVGLGLGATTGPQSGYGFVAIWFTIMGLGLGLAMPIAANAALAPLSEERSGVGSALLMTLRQVGGSIGVAILGTVLSSGYTARLDLTGLPAQVADAVKDSVNTGVAVARAMHLPALFDSVRDAFVYGMDSALWVCGGVALAGVLLALLFLPTRSATMETTDEQPPPSTESTRPEDEPVAGR